MTWCKSVTTISNTAVNVKKLVSTVDWTFVCGSKTVAFEKLVAIAAFTPVKSIAVIKKNGIMPKKTPTVVSKSKSLNKSGTFFGWGGKYCPNDGVKTTASAKANSKRTLFGA